VFLFVVAAWGPLLVLAAVPVVIKLHRKRDPTLIPSAVAWVALLSAIASAAYFFLSLEPTLELP